MSYVVTALLGAAIGYIAAYFQHNPTAWPELKALFKKKDGA